MVCLLQLLSRDVSRLVYIESHRYNLSAVNDEYRRRYRSLLDGSVYGSTLHWSLHKCYNYRNLDEDWDYKSIHNKHSKKMMYYLPDKY